MLILSGGIVCRICTVWPKRRKLLLSPWALSPNVLPESRIRRFLLQFLVDFTISGYAKRLWCLVTRFLIIYYEQLRIATWESKHCGTITAFMRIVSSHYIQ